MLQRHNRRATLRWGSQPLLRETKISFLLRRGGTGTLESRALVTAFSLPPFLCLTTPFGGRLLQSLVCTRRRFARAITTPRSRASGIGGGVIARVPLWPGTGERAPWPTPVVVLVGQFTSVDERRSKLGNEQSRENGGEYIRATTERLVKQQLKPPPPRHPIRADGRAWRTRFKASHNYRWHCWSACTGPSVHYFSCTYSGCSGREPNK